MTDHSLNVEVSVPEKAIDCYIEMLFWYHYSPQFYSPEQYHSEGLVGNNGVWHINPSEKLYNYHLNYLSNKGHLSVRVLRQSILRLNDIGKVSFDAPVDEKTNVKTTSTAPHYVYVMETIENLNVKIGVSKNPEQRCKEINKSHPCEVSIYACWEVPSRKLAYTIEKACHNALDDCRLVGEWFDISPEKAAALVDKTIANEGGNK